jgi:hypothetical protein
LEEIHAAVCLRSSLAVVVILELMQVDGRPATCDTQLDDVY